MSAAEDELVMQALGLGLSRRTVAEKLGVTEERVWQAILEPRYQPAPEPKPKLWQRRVCDVCGKPLAYQRGGTRRRRHMGKCAEKAKAAYRRQQRRGTAGGDDPAHVIEAKLRQAEAHVRARQKSADPLFAVDGWQRREA